MVDIDHLMHCAESGSTDQLHEVLKMHSTARDAQQNTVLMALISSSKWNIVQEVLTWGDVDPQIDAQQARTGCTAMHLAILRDAPLDILSLLIKHGADVAAECADGETPLSLAMASDNKQAATVLAAGLSEKNVNIKLKTGQTPLEFATAAGDSGLMAELIRRGSDIAKSTVPLMKDAIERKDDVLLSALVGRANTTAIDMLDVDYKRMLKSGMPCSACAWLQRFDKQAGLGADDEGNTYLHDCAKDGGTYGQAVALVNIGLSVNEQNRDGNTPLHLAARAGNTDVARALCALGANVMARNKKNRTAKMMPQIASDMKDFLFDIEELYKEGKMKQQSALWDDKMKSTQTESAFGLQCL